ncbi:MAG TPA: DUF167 domain-containing protein [Trebonia sp.]|nr:DUF167 domain-containing protein [Trebonia sp.]
MRITIRVKPGSARPGVGGEHDGALIVRVSARAADGKATEAALAAVAESFGIRRSTVRLFSGASSRTKVIDIDAVDPLILAALLAAASRLRLRHDAAATPTPDPQGREFPAVEVVPMGQFHSGAKSAATTSRKPTGSLVRPMSSWNCDRSAMRSGDTAAW